MTIKKTVLKTIGVIALLTATIYFSYPFILKKLALTLIDTKHQPTKNADALVVLAGDDGERVKKAAELYHQKKAPKVFITGNTLYAVSIPAIMKQAAIKRGIPRKNIFIESKSTSTKDHPEHLKPLLKEHHIKSIIIVTSKFHTNRAYKVFEKSLSTSNITISIVGAEDHINYSEWWKDHESTEAVIIELGKTVWYALE